MNFLLIIVGLVVLILGGNWLLKAAVALSLKLDVPKIVIGMTVVSFATSAPELIVSINAALSGASDLALGNVVGSNIANLGLVLAITLMLSKIDVEKSFYKTDWPVMMIVSVVLYFFVTRDQVISSSEGIVLFSLLVFFLIYLLRFQKPAVVVDEVIEERPLPLWKTVAFLALGGLCLWAGSEFLIKGSVALAQDFGISERIIGVTIISVGTSIPELAASVIAVIKKEKGISLGNLIGSNIFNILAVLGITSMITPVSVTDQGLLTNDIFWMLGFSFVILPLVFIPSKMRLDWKDGLILIAGYGLFLYYTIK